MKDISYYVEQVRLTKPNRNEIIKSYSQGIDESYVDNLLNSFDLAVTEHECPSSNLFVRLIECTTAFKCSFGGISFVKEVRTFAIGRDQFIQFASFQENILATDIAFGTFVYIDYSEPNGKPIIFRLKLDQERFLDMLLFLLKLSTDFGYRGKIVNKTDVDRALQIVGDRNYRDFIDLIFSQYI